MAAQLIFNKSLAGRLVTVLRGYIQNRDTFELVDETRILKEVTLTGWFTTIQGLSYYQTTDSLYRYVTLLDNTMPVQYDSTGNSSGYDAQQLVNGIIKNNKRILENNLICARFAYKLSDTQRDLLYNLQSRLEIRDNALVNTQLISKAYITYPKGYENESSYLKKFMDDGGKVGLVLSGTATIVVSAIVLSSVGAAAYFAYQAYYAESMDDVKYSDELTAILADKLTPEELQMLKDETAGIVTKARLTSSVGSFGNLLKWAAYGFAAYTIYKLIAPKAKEAYKNYKNKEK